MSANFAKAVESLQKAQQQFETPTKDMTNAYLGNKYASLDSCINAIKPALFRNGFALVQSGGKDDLGHFVDTKFVHVTGEVFSSKIYLELDKNNMQGVGSAITYAKRYGLLSLSGMEPDENPDDDDGNKASGTKPKKGRMVNFNHSDWGDTEPKKSSNEQKPEKKEQPDPKLDGLDL